MKLGVEVGLGPGHIVLDGEPVPPKKCGNSLPTFWPMYCGQTAGWIKMPLGTEVGLGPSHIVLDGDPASPSTKRGTAADHFSVMSIVAKYGRPSRLLLSCCYCLATVNDAV